MDFLILAILILGVLALHPVKGNKARQSGRACKSVENAAKKTLSLILKGLVMIGLLALAISQFGLVRRIGFAVIPPAWIKLIRMLLSAVFNTSSVYVAVQTMISILWLTVSICLIFSFVGIVATKYWKC